MILPRGQRSIQQTSAAVNVEAVGPSRPLRVGKKLSTKRESNSAKRKALEEALATATDYKASAEAITTATESRYTEGVYASALNTFTQVLTAGLKGNPFPVTYEVLLSAMGRYVVGPPRRKSSGLKGYLSRLKMGARAGNKWSVNELEYEDILRKADIMCKLYPTTVKPAKEIRKDLLERMSAYLSSKGGPEAMETWTIALLLHQSLVRGGEILNGSLKAKHIKVSADSATLSLPFHKTGKKTYDERNDKAVVLKRNDMFDAVDALVTYARKRDKIWGDGPRGEEPAFTEVSGKPISWTSFQKNARKCLKALNILEWNDYSVHSFRSGGLTDMIAENVPLDECARRGRWKSNTMLQKYWRPTTKDLHQTAGKS